MASDSTRKVVIVTGGGSGIGQATVVEFAKKGYNVVISDKARSKLEKTVALCKSEGLTDDNMVAVEGDVTKPADNESIVRESMSKFNRIDVLVNNAGFIIFSTFEKYSLEQLDAMYNVFVRGTFDMTQKVMPHLLKTKGNVITVSSIFSTMPNSLDIGYMMMKAALDHFTRAISVDYAPKGVRVNTVNPGVVRTGINDDHFAPEDVEKRWSAFASAMPIGKIIQPVAVARLILFLASDDASFITGANVPIDGAWRNTMALPK